MRWRRLPGDQVLDDQHDDRKRAILEKRAQKLSKAGYCSVCARELPLEDRQSLVATGWLISGDAAVCVACQDEGWELPAHALVPLRRSTAEPDRPAG